MKHGQINTNSSLTGGASAFAGGIHRFTNIICHLRDDLAAEDPRHHLPLNGDIERWVAENFYPALLELTWEEAVLSLLSRMRHTATGAQIRKIFFAEVAMARLRRATQHAQIWRI